MCDLHFKFEEDRLKTVVAVENDRYFGQTCRWTETDRQTDSDFYLSYAMNCIGQTIKLRLGGRAYSVHGPVSAHFRVIHANKSCNASYEVMRVHCTTMTSYL